MSRIVDWFLHGLVFVIPIALTVWLFFAVFSALDSVLGLPIPGVGLLAMLVFITGIGFLTSNYVTRRFLTAFERGLDRLPFAKLLHGSMKDLMSAFVGEKKRFDKPVIVDLAAGGGVKTLGFVTRDSMEVYGMSDAVAVYFPQSYNFAGQVVIVPRSAVHPVSADSADVMAFIVSGGVAGGGAPKPAA